MAASANAAIGPSPASRGEVSSPGGRNRVIIVGAGGHAHVVADILRQAAAAGQDVYPLGFLDDAPGLTGARIQGLPVLGALADLSSIPHDAVIVAIGDNATRQRLFTTLQAAGEHFAVARHPASILASDVVLGPGVMVCAGAIAGPASSIGANTILNTGCTVDHHAIVGEHVHIAPGVHMGGEVSVGAGALIGIGAVVLPRRRVGAWAVVGAGAVVIDDVPAHSTVVGLPARPLQR